MLWSMSNKPSSNSITDTYMNIITIKKVKNNQEISCIIIKDEKLNDSDITTKFKKSNPKKISILATNKQALIAAKTEYLFLLKYPVKIIQKLKTIDNNDA